MFSCNNSETANAVTFLTFYRLNLITLFKCRQTSAYNKMSRTTISVEFIFGDDAASDVQLFSIIPTLVIFLTIIVEKYFILIHICVPKSGGIVLMLPVPVTKYGHLTQKRSEKTWMKN